MKNRWGVLMLGLCLVAFLSGFGAKRLAHSSGSSRETEREAGTEKGAKSARSSSARAVGEASANGSADANPSGSSLRSTDTIEDLIALGDDELYGRLALWMLDASEEDIATFWEHYAGREDRAKNTTNADARSIIDLVFIQWTRLNPLAATAAAEGTKFEEFAWWAWGCHDPKSALAAAVENKPGRLHNVGWGIGEFHPEWLRKHFDEMPEQAGKGALAGFAKWAEGSDPLAMLDFLSAHNSGLPNGMIKNLIRSDPWAAVDWFQKNGGKVNNSYGRSGQSNNVLVKNLAKYHPEILAQVAEREPAGARKRSMEQALFENLMKSDLEAAIEQAEGTAAPRVAAGRLARVGVELAHADPERAYEMLEQLVKLYPNSSRMATAVQYPGGSTSFGSSDGKTNELIGILLAKDPGRLMELDAPAWTQDAASKWASQDVEEFAGWLAKQSEEAVTKNGPLVVNQLNRLERFDEAMDWALAMGEQRKGYVGTTLNSWSRHQPEEARAWIENAELSESDRKTYEGFLHQSR